MDRDEESDKGYIHQVDFKHPEEINEKHSDFLFFLKRMKIDKFEKLVCNLSNKKKTSHIHKSSEAGIGSSIKAKETAKFNQIQSGRLAEVIQRYGYEI